MKIGAITLTLAFSMGFAFLVLAGMPPASDAQPCPSTMEVAAGEPDDGIGDCVDNCQERWNVAQIDSNGDGYGNYCDADFDGDLGVGLNDYGTMKKVLGFAVGPVCDAKISPIPCVDVDMDSDGAIGLSDFALMKKDLAGPPGPSA